MIRQAFYRTVLTVILFGTVWYLIPKILHRGYDPCEQIRAVYKEEYKGKVIRKYIEKIKKIEMRSYGNNITAYHLTDELWNYVKPGDSIFKSQGFNYCIVKRSSTLVKFNYVYLNPECKDTSHSSFQK